MFRMIQRYPWDVRKPDQVPKDLRKRLADTEVNIRGGQVHEAIMYGPMAIVGLITAVAFFVLATVDLKSSAMQWFLILGTLASWLWLWWRWFEWCHQLIFFTGYRIIYMHGLITKTIAMLPIGKVTDMRYDETPGGQIFGYVRFIIESAGQIQALRNLNFVPDPDVTYKYLQDTLFSKGTTNVNIIDINLLHPRATEPSKMLPVSLRGRLRQNREGGGPKDTVEVDGRPWWND